MDRGDSLKFLFTTWRVINAVRFSVGFKACAYIAQKCPTQDFAFAWNAHVRDAYLRFAHALSAD
jgi:hypothetical protein